MGWIIFFSECLEFIRCAPGALLPVPSNPRGMELMHSETTTSQCESKEKKKKRITEVKIKTLIL